MLLNEMFEKAHFIGLHSRLPRFAAILIMNFQWDNLFLVSFETSCLRLKDLFKFHHFSNKLLRQNKSLERLKLFFG